MAETYKVLYQGQPSTSMVTVYTVPGSTSAIVKQIRLVNVSVAAATIKLCQGGTADANCILPAVSLGPGEWAEFDGSIFMATGTTLAAQAQTASAITMTVHGVEIS